MSEITKDSKTVSLILLVSYFGVPTYEEQTRGNPQRLVQFVTASSGDASMLNPILSADSASSQIEALVFEGLIDRDENLQFRGRVAKDWNIYEHAYFFGPRRPHYSHCSLQEGLSPQVQ